MLALGSSRWQERDQAGIETRPKRVARDRQIGINREIGIHRESRWYQDLDKQEGRREKALINIKTGRKRGRYQVFGSVLLSSKAE